MNGFGRTQGLFPNIVQHKEFPNIQVEKTHKSHQVMVSADHMISSDVLFFRVVVE